MRLRSPSVTLLRFACVGALNSAVGFGVIVLLQQLLGIDKYLANGAGFAAGLLIGFAGNANWTFRNPQHSSSAFTRYLFAFLASYLVNILALSFLLRFTRLSPILAQFVAVASYSGTFYLACRHFVFRFVPPASERKS